MVGTSREDVLDRLEATLDRTQLPDRLRASGQALAKRLAAPVRLSFMGMPGVGKTTLIRALLGPDVPAMNGYAPTYELTYGATERTRLTLEDGTRRDIAGADVADMLDFDPVFVELHTPCPHLHSIRVLELVTDGTQDEMGIAAPWAAQRCDIPIWCSRGFDAREAEIWAKIPAAKKDHAMLVLTQADTVKPEDLIARLDHAFDVEGTGFCIIAPVAARHALSAQMAKRPDAEKILDATGIGALRSEIFRRVDQGRQLDLDHAEIFLSRFEKPKVRKASKPLPTSDTQTVNTAVTSKCMQEGAQYVRQQAQEMLTDIEEFGPYAPGKIVERCLETANNLVDLIADETPVGDRHMLAHSAVSDAADMLLLMTLENTAGAAEDAVSLMSQVKREFELAA